MAHSRLSYAAARHYPEVVKNLPHVNIREGPVGYGFFTKVGVSAVYLNMEYRGTPLVHAEPGRERKRRTAVGLTEGYALSVEVCDVIIDVWMEDGDGRHVNHSCSPNARYITIRMTWSDSDVVLVEA